MLLNLLQNKRFIPVVHKKFNLKLNYPFLLGQEIDYTLAVKPTEKMRTALYVEHARVRDFVCFVFKIKTIETRR